MILIYCNISLVISNAYKTLFNVLFISVDQSHIGFHLNPWPLVCSTEHRASLSSSTLEPTCVKCSVHLAIFYYYDTCTWDEWNETLFWYSLGICCEMYRIMRHIRIRIVSLNSCQYTPLFNTVHNLLCSVYFFFFLFHLLFLCRWSVAPPCNLLNAQLSALT